MLEALNLKNNAETRYRCQFKGSAGPGPNVDLSKFAYKARNQIYEPANNSLSNKPTETGLVDEDWEDTDVGQGSRSNRVSDWMELDMFRQQREQFYTVEAEQSYVEDDQTSLPDLTSGYQEPAPNDQYDEFWNEQNNNGNDDFAHETDYGYFYVNCDDMQKTPKEWDDQITQEPSGCSRPGGRMPQTTHPKNNRGMRTLPQKVPANRKPLFQNRRPNHLNVARSMKNNYVYDDNNKTELQDNEICDNDNYSEINDNGISDNCNGYDKELIDNYESDEEQTASRWTNFANSQSSEDTDYLNQPFPDKLESRSKSRHNVQESEGETQPRNGPQFNKNKGILKQPLPSMNAPNSINGQSCRNTLNSVTERISMKPSFLNNRNGNKTMKRNNFPDNFRGLGMLQSKRANTENVNCGYSKGGARRAIESMKQSQWKNVKNGQLAGLNVAGKDEGIGNNQQQSRKFGQVLAWVSNSQNKPESRSPSEWEDWGDDTAMFDEADKTTIAADENMARSSKSAQPKFSNQADVEVKTTKENPKLKPTGFSSFFSRDVDQDRTDTFINIFDGIF